MRRIILTALSLLLLGGVASADHKWRWRDTSNHSGGTVVRDRRWREPVRVERRHDRRDYRRVRVDRRPVYVSNGRFAFGNGVVRVYNRPVIRHRYYDYRYRPQLVVENYDPVPGYVWIQGSWSWNGSEWIWVNGYYSPDASYYGSYDGGYYPSSYDDDCDHDDY